MKIFARDLKSPELRGFVETNGERLSAEDGTEDWAVDAEELTDCFVRFARLFTQAETGITLVDAAVKDWPVFSSEVAARRVLGAVFEKQSLDFALTDKVTLRPDLESGVATWQRLKREVREEKRFFANFYASELDEWLSPQGWLKQGTDFFRARIVPKGEQAWGTDDMGCPPVDKASGGGAQILRGYRTFISPSSVKRRYTKCGPRIWIECRSDTLSCSVICPSLILRRWTISLMRTLLTTALLRRW